MDIIAIIESGGSEVYLFDLVLYDVLGINSQF